MIGNIVIVFVIVAIVAWMGQTFGVTLITVFFAYQLIRAATETMRAGVENDPRGTAPVRTVRPRVGATSTTDLRTSPQAQASSAWRDAARSFTVVMPFLLFFIMLDAGVSPLIVAATTMGVGVVLGVLWAAHPAAGETPRGVPRRVLNYVLLSIGQCCMAFLIRAVASALRAS